MTETMLGHIARTAFKELPLGAVKPAGWLLRQLKLQADGLTGHLEDLWPDVGPDSAWLGGGGEDWERGPYYLDGLVPLAHVLGDPVLIAKAQKWIEAILGSQRPGGFFGPQSNDDWWPRMCALKALTQHFDATGDARVPPFMTAYFRHQLAHLPGRPLSEWGEARGQENVLTVLWLHQRTGEPFLLELADLIRGQTLDWADYLRNRLIQTPADTFDHHTHVVNVAMSLKGPALTYLLTGEAGQEQVFRESLANLDRLHGMVNGMFSGDEWLAGTGPQHGVELCAVVELMYSLETQVRVFGDGADADRLELVAFNALAATLSADMRSHQYHQQVNQVLCTVDQRDWTMSSDDANIFGLEPHFGCCTANLHQGWPKLTRAAWMATPQGLAAVSYVPCEVEAEIGGQRVRLTVQTDYPFEETVRIGVQLSGPAHFALDLRIPGWCREASLSVNGEALGCTPNARGFARVERRWQDGDRIELTLPMTVRALPRPGGALGLALGPLVLALSPGELWTKLPTPEGFGDWEIRNRRSWNYALDFGGQDPASACRVERFPVPDLPFSLGASRPDAGVTEVALRVHTPARRLPDWLLERNSAASPPPSPVNSQQPVHHVQLVPYGCARLRIAEFPVQTLM
ncbi:beta-L-arabinofuranosidase domain-containing protein [Deinococcus sp.]|uniref:beta-L-arabinofuranosidase domain-containing protein n=1 Tax=Deinococcus sp. TaxID=47478 RepID=UPI003CC57B37